MMSKMSKFMAIVLTAYILICSSEVSGGIFNRKKHVKIQGLLPKPGDTVGTERDVLIGMDNVADEIFKLKKLKTGAGQKFSAPKGSSFSSGKRDGDSLSCFSKGRSDADDTEQVCVANVKDRDGKKESCFIRNSKALCFDYPPDNAVIDEGIVPHIPEDEEMSPEDQHGNERRRRRSLQPGLVNTGFVKVLYFVDGRFMNTFVLFSDGNVTQAKEDATAYLMLITNEMTLIYQSLTNRGTLEISEESTNLDIAIYMADVEFPQNNDTAYHDPSWVDPVDGELQSSLGNFRTYMNTYNTTIKYDQATAITGYKIPGNLISKAYVGTICHAYWSTKGYQTSIAEFNGGLDRILAHEIGHGFGMQHDNSTECPTSTYVMSSLIINSAKTDTYDVFSNCSVVDIVSKLNKLYTDGKYISTCLYNHNVTANLFLDKFCEGTYHSLSFDDQCKQRVHWTSSSCSNFGKYVNETHVSNCSTRGIKCLNLSNSCKKFVNEVADGTPCVKDDATTPHVCFQAECQPVYDWCSTTTPT